MEAAGASKDNFGGILSSSGFPRNPKILKSVVFYLSRDSFRRNPVGTMRTRGLVTFQPSVLLIWAPVSEPGFLKFQIFRFSILEIFVGGNIFEKYVGEISRNK